MNLFTAVKIENNIILTMSIEEYATNVENTGFSTDKMSTTDLAILIRAYFSVNQNARRLTLQTVKKMKKHPTVNITSACVHNSAETVNIFVLRKCVMWTIQINMENKATTSNRGEMSFDMQVATA